MSGRPCELCGFESKKIKHNKKIERQHHLYHMHYKARIEFDLRNRSNFFCPLCPYIGKNKWLLTDHYICDHKVVEKYLSQDIATGRVETLFQKQAKEAADTVQQNMVAFTPATTSVDLPSVIQTKTLASATSKTTLSSETTSLKPQDDLNNSKTVRYFVAICN